MAFVNHVKSKTKAQYDLLIGNEKLNKVFFLEGETDLTGLTDEQKRLLDINTRLMLEGKDYTGVKRVELLSDTANGHINVDGTDITVYAHPTTTAANAAAVKVGKDTAGHVVLGDALTAGDVGVSLNNGVITIGNQSITPLTSHQSLSSYATQSWVNDKFDDMLGINADAVSTLKSVLSDDDKTTGLLVQIAGKVDKEAGKGLSTNDYTDAEKDKVTAAYNHSQSTHARVDATKVEASTNNGYIKINGTDTKVYEHPAPTAAEVKAALGVTNGSTSKYLKEDGTWDTPDKGVTFVAGSSGNVTTEMIATALTGAGYELTDTTYDNASTSAAGLMSAQDKTNLEALIEAMTWQ